MNEEIRSLIESLRRGDYDDPTEKITLLAAALRQENVPQKFILDLLQAPQIPLRLAGIEACEGRREKDLLDTLAKLVQDPIPRVRVWVAHILDKIQHPEQSSLLATLLHDTNAWVRQVTLKTSSGQPQFLAWQTKLLLEDSEYFVREAAAAALGAQKDLTQVVPSLFQALLREESYDVQRQCADLLENFLTRSPGQAEAGLPRENISHLNRALEILKELGGQRHPKFSEWLCRHTAQSVDPEALPRFGSDLTAQALEGTLPHAYGLEELCQSLLAKINQPKRRSLVLLGESGTGKTALIHELVHHLHLPQNGAWRVLRISPSDFLVGTHYIGEWETKLQELVAAVRLPKPVLLYIPNLSELSTVGRHSKSDANVAAALAPHVEDGSIMILGESTPQEYERGLGALPALRRLFEPVLIREATMAETRSLLDQLCRKEECPAEERVLDQLQELGNQFLSHIHRPGNAVSLLRASLGLRQGETQPNAPLTIHHGLAALTQSTGIPARLLDDSATLDLQEVQAFFEHRIMGQPEALEAVVDLVALIKAGLSDPQKPFAVMLFIGPTGVGKTELARGLAEFIFGDPARLQRFDMSEYASFEGFERLIGNREQTGVLTDAVRRQPFSVVLLDEIEKSHVNVFDLCLQIFDAGRLTDGRGRMVDFRRTILILTSNIGASTPASHLGFHSLSAPPASPKALEPDADRTFRELSQFFRPEFLNRLDRIIPFRSLSLEVAEKIARRELDLVLQRSGITRRQLVVDLDPAIISLLVKEGYSAHFGARPIKRTVQQLCLMPLAKAIATGRIHDRSVLHLGLHRGKVQVRLTRAPADSPAAARPRATSGTGESLTDQAARLTGELDALQPSVQPLADRKSELLQKTQEPGFYDRHQIKSETFDEIHKLDLFLNQFGGLEKALRNLAEHLKRRPAKPGEEAACRERLQKFKAELNHLRFILRCRNASDLSDTLLCLSRVDQKGDAISGVENLAHMYLGLAKFHHFEASILGEGFDEKSDRAYVQVNGLGAHALLKLENGLHQFTRRQRHRDPGNGREKTRQDREIIRVRVLPLTGEPDKPFWQTLKTTVKSLKPAQNRLVPKANLAVTLFHQPSLRSLHIWTAGPRKAAQEKAGLILHAEIDAEKNAPANPEDTTTVVRQYRFGLAPQIKDTRTGRASSQVEKILQGRLDAIVDYGQILV